MPYIRKIERAADKPIDLYASLRYGFLNIKNNIIKPNNAHQKKCGKHPESFISFYFKPFNF